MTEGATLARQYDVLIVGAGHGGAQAAIALRQRGFAGRMALLGAEADPPYERPPLSKDYLTGGKPFERILIRPAAFWAERGVDLLLGTRVVGIDADARRCLTADGGTVGYGTLIWAAGGDARRLSCEGHDLAGVHTVRTRADVDLLRTEIGEPRRVAVVGGGYVGLEATAGLRMLGHDVVLLEALPRVLARVAGEPLSRFYEAEHRRQGVDMRLNVTVEAIEGHRSVEAVRLASGERIACDLVIVGIGIVPAVEPLLAAGAEGGNGAAVDADCRTSLPDVYAIGDCALHANPYARGRAIRLESVQNANDMAATIARALMGDPAPYRALPWFWSNQYDLKLQTIGLSDGHDEAIVRGDPATRAFSVVYRTEGRVIALDCVNAVKDFVGGRALIESGTIVDAAALADSAVPLKAWGAA